MKGLHEIETVITPRATARRVPAWKHALGAVLVLTALLTLPARRWPRDDHRAQDVLVELPTEKTWKDMSPERNLIWHPCYGGEFDCARLDVPMDWLDPTDDLRVVLAVIRLRATDRDNYGGPVFFNPGGPGGSGIWAMRDHGSNLQDVVGKNYDIITFDPRGIGASVPRIDCWGSAQNNQFWDLQDVGVVDSHPGTIYDAYARMSAYTTVCEASMGDTGILRHSSTASHARDMLEILHQLGEEKLKYWGFSYGTILGGTFAAMYPEKVERLVSDGNVDYREWHEKTHLNFLHDTDKVMQAFFDLCHRAGPDVCAFYAPSPDAIKTRLEVLFTSLRVHPVVVPADKELGPEIPDIVTYSRVRKVLSSTLYQPQRSFPRFAKTLLALENGDGRPFYEQTSGKEQFAAVCQAETIPPTTPLTGFDEGTEDAFGAVMCSDSVPLPDTVDGFVQIVKDYEQMSYAAGATNANFPIACVNRQVRPKWRFSGPFEGNTSFPILYVANIADNVTPLISARNNSAGFPSSVVLVQQGYGHTSLASPSTCTAKIIRDYFQQGLVPLPDTECHPDVLPFGLPTGAAVVEEADLSLAISQLSEKVSAYRSRMSRLMF